MIKLVLTDLDDTLIKNGLPRATDHAIAGIHAMLDAGLRFGPVSGRIPSDMSWMFGGDPACYATGALVNGQMVYADGKLAHVEVISSEVLNRLAVELSQIPGTILTMYELDTPSDEGSAYFVSPSKEHAEHCGSIFRHIRRWVPELTEPTYVKANIWCAGEREHLIAVRESLRAHFPALDFVFPSNKAPLIDVSPAGWNKGSAVRCLAHELGLSLDEIAVFGDSENDLSMIEAVPNSVAVSNASKEVACAAKWHIGSSADDAVADALFQIAEAAHTCEMPAFMRGESR